jgi:hypothetical protein
MTRVGDGVAHASCFFSVLAIYGPTFIPTFKVGAILVESHMPFGFR